MTQAIELDQAAGRKARQEVLEVLEEADEPLDQDEIATRVTNLTQPEVEEAVSELVDRGKLAITMDWKYEDTTSC